MPSYLIVFKALTGRRANEALRLPWTAVGTLLLAASTTVAISTGLLDLADQREKQGEELAQRLRIQLAPPQLVSGRAVEPGLKVIRPPNASAVLVGGAATGLAASWDIGPAGAEATEPYVFERSRMSAQLTLPPEMVVPLFGSLFALVFSLWLALADITAKWPEVATGWRVPGVVIASSDLLGNALVLSVVVAAWFGSVAAYLAFAADGVPKDLWIDWMCLAPTTWLCLMSFAGLGSALAYAIPTPSRIIVGATVAWLVLALLAPLAVQVLAEFTPSTPTLLSFQRDRRETYADRFATISSALNATLSAQGATVPDAHERRAMLTGVFDGLEPEWTRQMLSLRQQIVDAEQQYWNQRSRDQRTARWLARLTPLTAFSNALADQAGSGSTYAEGWEAAVREYVAHLRLALFDDRPLVNAKITYDGEVEVAEFRRHPALAFDDLPELEVPQSGGRWHRTKDAMGDIIAVGCHALAALIIAGAMHMRELRRYRRLVPASPA